MNRFKFAVTLILSICMIAFLVFSATAKNKEGKKCTMDVQCGTGGKCEEGVCVGGINPSIKGKCVKGKFGKKVCSNTGDPCHNNSECWK